MSRVTDEELVQLVQEKGEQYWANELKRAGRAVLVYAAVLVVAVVVAVAVSKTVEETPELMQPLLASMLSYLPWASVMFATIYVGASQVRLLPFMGSTPLLHWLIVSVFAVLGCGGPLWLAMFAGSNSSAKRRLNDVIASINDSEPGE